MQIAGRLIKGYSKIARVIFGPGSLDSGFFIFWLSYHAQHAWKANFNGSDPTASVSVTLLLINYISNCTMFLWMQQARLTIINPVWILGDLDLKIKKKSYNTFVWSFFFLKKV